MPYLHWETSRNQKLFAEVCENISHDKKCLEEEQEKLARDKWRHDRGRARNSAVDPDIIVNIRPTATRVMRAAFDLPQRRRPRRNYFDLSNERYNRASPRNKLAQYLFDAARLFEAMSLYADTEMHKKFLTAHHPLHARRTLDQDHYWSLANTRGRDRDQFVLRATARKYYELYHGSTHVEEDICGICAESARKVPRVLMVDQLWMWILDAKTVLTCFPTRYGTNNFDCSDVYKSVEARCYEYRSVESAFELALIIFEECSTTMLSRRAIPDERPEVVRAFSEAISDIVSSPFLFCKIHTQTKTSCRFSSSSGRGGGFGNGCISPRRKSLFH